MSVVLLELFERFLGESRNHNDSTGQVSFNCPACADDKGLPSGDGKFKLAVNYNNDVYKCWVCKFENHMYGHIPNLIKRYGNNEIYKEYRRLKPENDIITSIFDAPQILVEKPEGFKLLSECNKYHYKYSVAYDYLIKERGLTDDIIKKYNIGYTTEGKYHDRIIIPSIDEFGDWDFFVSRSWDKWVKPKYLNPEAEKQLLIYNLNKINWDSTVYLVEGVFDHIVIPNSIPMLGKYLSPKLLSTIYTNAKADVIVLLDDDAYDDALIVYKELNIGILYNRIKICIPPVNYDPSLIYKKMGNDGIVKLLRNSKFLKESVLY